MAATSEFLFVAVEIGEAGSPERTRADELTDYVIEPVSKEFNLEVKRADREATPGRITHQIIKAVLDAAVVVADVTGQNPNVYYELAVAHAFQQPVIMLVDDPDNIAFDTRDERVIALGEHEAELSLTQGEDAKQGLRRSLEIVLGDDYRPSSVVSSVGGSRSLDQLAPEDPIAAEIGAIRDDLQELGELLADMRNERAHDRGRRNTDNRALKDTLMSVAERGLIEPHIFRRISDSKNLSNELRDWAQAATQVAEGAREDAVPF